MALEATSEQAHPASRPSGLGEFGRRLALVVGVGAGVALLIYAFFVLGMNACEGAGTYPPSDAWICQGGRDLLPWIEASLCIIGLLAPSVGGIGTFFDGRGFWLALGLAIAGLCFALIQVIVEAQVPTLS